MKYHYINKLLFDGYNLHVFRSGGGLRVAKLIKNINGVEHYFYGEGSILSEALRILNDDIKSEGRNYSDVYGKIETHYYTGSAPIDDLDEWVYLSRPFDVIYKNNRIEIDLTEYIDIHANTYIIDKVILKKETIYWEVDGINRLFKSYFDQNSCVTTTIPKRNGIEANNERIKDVRIYYGNSFDDAIFEAEKNVNKKNDYLRKEIPFEKGIKKEKMIK